MRLLWLAACGLAAGLLFHFAFAARYPLDLFGDRPRQSIGTLTRYSNEGAYWYIGGMAALFGVYALGFSLGLQGSAHLSPAQRRWTLALLAAGGAAFSLILLPMYPVDASDVYDYIARGRMSAVYGLNPLQDVPDQIKTDPFYRFASWRKTPSAYGPAWEIAAHALSALTSSASPNGQVIAYKLLAVAGYGLTALFIALTLRQIAPRRLLLGLYLFMWNPLVLYMTAGTGHNDTLMTACIAFALYSLSRRRLATATLGLALGALIKFIPALLVPLVVLAALQTLGLRRWLRYLAISALLGGLLTAVCYAPYWHGWDTLRAERRSVMFTASAAAVARQWLMPYLDGVTELRTPPRQTPNTNALLANGTLALFAFFYLSQLALLRRDRDPAAPMRIALRVMLFYVLVVSLWFHAWYAIWLLALAALLEDTPTRRLTVTFSYLVTWQAFLYNYIKIQTRSDQWLPWLDLVPVAIYIGFAWSYSVWHWVLRWHMRRRASPLDVEIGQRIMQARQAEELSLSQVSDELGIGYDELIQIEQGQRPLRIDQGRALAQRFGVSIEELLGTKA